jgi:hypothetical protein
VRELMRTSFAAEDVLDVSVEMEELAAAYMARKVVPAAFADDAQHVAVCSVARLDYLVSWNFKHLVNLRRETGFNSVKVLQGYPSVRSGWSSTKTITRALSRSCHSSLTALQQPSRHGAGAVGPS